MYSESCIAVMVYPFPLLILYFSTFQWGQNISLLHDRVLRYPDRVRNLYFTYLFVLRAVTKVCFNFVIIPLLNIFWELYLDLLEVDISLEENTYMINNYVLVKL